MKAKLVSTIETPKGTVELSVGTQIAPKHAWQVSGQIPKLYWKLNGKRATQREAAEALAEKVRLTEEENRNHENP
mgnify:CR=1 FL=1